MLSTPHQLAIEQAVARMEALRGTLDMEPRRQAISDLLQARIAAFKAGECCGDRRADGKCGEHVVCALRGNNECEGSGQ